MVRTSLSTLPGKLAAAAAGLTFATTGLAAASALPGPLQLVVSDVGGAVGVDLPVGDVTTPTTDVTTPTIDVTTPTTGTTPTTAGTGTTPTTTGTTPTIGAALLPAAATTASQAAHIHDFDEACGNHGAYVSFVARNGTEPACAAEVRTGASTPVPTVPEPAPDADSVEAAGDRSGPSAKAGSGKGGGQSANRGSKGSSGR